MMLPVAVMGQTYTWFESPKEVIEVTSLKVKEVWSPSEALAYGDDYVSYLIKQNDGNFYDDQKIKVSNGQEVRRGLQQGVFDGVIIDHLEAHVVPGGVGSVTTAILCRHIVEAAERTL